MVGAQWHLVLPAFTGDEAFDRCLGSLVEQMRPKTNGYWAALLMIGSVEPSFLVLPGFTHFGRAEPRISSQTSAWRWVENRLGIGWACMFKAVFNGRDFVLLGFTGGKAFARCRVAPVERMVSTTKGCWAALAEISVVKLSFLVLPGFTRSDRAKPPLRSLTSAWQQAQTRKSW
jgi:hypothetical protein